MKWVRAKQVPIKGVHFEKLHLVKICLVVFLCAARSWGADSKGYWQESCSQTTFYLGQSRNSELKGSVLQMRLPYELELLRLLPDWASPKWWDVTAKRCTSPDKCEDATQARIQFKKKYGAHAAGNYQVEFGGDQREEGTFVLKFRRMKPLPVCD